MDNISSYNSFEKYFLKKLIQTKKGIYGHLAFWFANDAWENKYQLKEWLVKLGVNEGVATWLAKDVLVIITDAWHAFKAVGILFILYPYVNIFSESLSVNFWLCYIAVFMISGQLFNVLFYKFKKLGQ
jgi:hypothetical protein